MCSRSAASSRGSANQRLDFSELLQLADFLSAFPPPDGLVLNKRVYITAGLQHVAQGTPTRKSVRDWVSALPYLLADPYTKWEGLLILQEAGRPLQRSDLFGKRGAAGGEVAALILSTSKREM
jgi:hypothetical protein